MSDQKTEKTAEQVAAEKADAFEYGMDRFLYRAGVTDPQQREQFKLAAAKMIEAEEAQKG